MRVCVCVFVTPFGPLIEASYLLSYYLPRRDSLTSVLVFSASGTNDAVVSRRVTKAADGRGANGGLS